MREHQLSFVDEIGNAAPLISSSHTTSTIPWHGAVTIHWTGLLDWNTGLDYWTGVFFLFWTSFCVFLVTFKYLTPN